MPDREAVAQRGDVGGRRLHRADAQQQHDPETLAHRFIRQNHSDSQSSRQGRQPKSQAEYQRYVPTPTLASTGSKAAATPF